jgi:hypothetical protein
VWQRALGGTGYDAAYAVRQTSDGGVIVAGTEEGGAGTGLAWLMKLSSSGSVEWSNAYGGRFDDTANAVMQTGDGGYVVAGGTSSYGVANGDLWVFKVDQSGSMQWQETLGSGEFDEASSVGVAADGGFFVSGRAWTSGASQYDAWVLKLDSAGSVPTCGSGFIGVSTASAIPVGLGETIISLSVLSTGGTESSSGQPATDSAVAATDVCAVSEPNIFASVTALDFGSVSIGSSYSKLILLTNAGTGPLSIGSVTKSGQKASEFSIGGGCATIAIGASCSMTVTYTPLSAEAALVLLNVSSNDPDTPVLAITLSGTGSAVVQKMEPPTGVSGIVYPGVAVPVIDTDPSLALPFAVGNVDGGMMSLRVALPAFTAPVDIHLLLYLPDIDPFDLFSIWAYPENRISLWVPWQTAWMTGVTGPVNASIFGDVPLRDFPRGTYLFGLFVFPSGRTDALTYWVTWFSIP